MLVDAGGAKRAGLGRAKLGPRTRTQRTHTHTRTRARAYTHTHTHTHTQRLGFEGRAQGGEGRLVGHEDHLVHARRAAAAAEGRHAGGADGLGDGLAVGDEAVRLGIGLRSIARYDSYCIVI